MADGGTLAALRRRLDEIRTRHEVDARGAAEAFWSSLRRSPAGDACADAPPATTCEAVRGGAATPSSRRAVRPGARHGGAWTRASLAPRGRGVWAHIPPGEALAAAPRDLSWHDDQDDLCDDAHWWQATAGPDHGVSPAGGTDDTGWPPSSGRPATPGRLTAADIEGAGPSWRQDDSVAVKIDAAIGRRLDRHPEEQVVIAAEQLATLRGQHDVMLVNLVAELEARGVESPGGLSRTDWLRSLDPGMSAAQAKAFVTVGRALTEAHWAGLGARVTLQHVSVGKAAQIIDFHQRLAPVGDPRDVTSAVDDLIAQASQLTPEDLARLTRHHTEQVRPPRDDDRLDAGRQAARGLWFSQPNATGMVAMRATLDPEAAAILKSAVDPLSTPCPTRDEHGRTVEPDPRTPANRRADALLEMVQRGVASAESVPTTDKAKIVVTIDHDVLAGRVAGTGLAMSGEVLSASTVRRLACDAAIVPMVLGGASEPLDLGRERRLVTRGLRLALWQRDGGCSFPNCTIPASWCDAHHVTPWYLGGHTSLTTMALLCRRHHTHVHRNDLTATTTATTVTWHE